MSKQCFYVIRVIDDDIENLCDRFLQALSIHMCNLSASRIQIPDIRIYYLIV